MLDRRRAAVTLTRRGARCSPSAESPSFLSPWYPRPLSISMVGSSVPRFDLRRDSAEGGGGCTVSYCTRQACHYTTT